jgi:CBS domain containing-hemolysin-like protein
MEDLIEEIVGDIRDEYDAEEANLIRKLEDNHYSIDASVKLDDLNDAINTELESEHYDSLGGYVIELMDRLPDEGDEVCDDAVRIKVLKMHKNRIERVELFLLQTQEQEEENQPEEEKNH